MTDEGVRNRNTPSADSHPGGATSLQTSETRFWTVFGRWWVTPLSWSNTLYLFSLRVSHLSSISPRSDRMLCYVSAVESAAPADQLHLISTTPLHYSRTSRISVPVRVV